MFSAKVSEIRPAALLKDLRPFLEDETDAAWIKDYGRAFDQLLRQQPAFKE